MDTFAMIVIFGFGTIISVLFFVFAIRMTKNLQRGQQDQALYFREFLEKTGYRLADMMDAPLDEHVRSLEQRYGDPLLWQQGFKLEYERHEYGKVVQLQIFYRNARSGSVWRVPLDKPPPLQFHVLKGVKTAPAFSTQVKIGDPQWDKHFKVYGEDPQALRQLLPVSGLRDMLESCITVDLRVLAGEVIFSDPRNKNVNAALGGLMGQAITGSDPKKNQDMVNPVYNHITDLVLLAASLD